MEISAFVFQVIQDQGLVASLLAYMILSQNGLLKALIVKNCEMTRFMMSCLDREYALDHPPVQRHSQNDNNENRPREP